MTFALVLLGIALAISLAFNLGLVGAKAPTPANPNAPQRSESRASGDDTRKLEAELEKEHDTYIYEVELLTVDGVVRELELDARNGRILKDKEDD